MIQLGQNTYYVDTGFMYIEQDLATGQVRNVTDSFAENGNALEYPSQKTLAITDGTRPGSVIVPRNEVLTNGETVVRRSTVVPQTEGSVIIPRREGSVIIPRKEGSVIIPKREGSVILHRKEGSVIVPQKQLSVINGSVVGRSVGYQTPRVVQRIVSTPRERIVESPREQYVTRVIERPQTVRVVRSNGYAPSVQSIPEGRISYVMDDSHMRGSYPVRRVIVRKADADYDDAVHRLYKTTINVSSSESDSSEGSREVIKTRYISTPSQQFKSVKGVPEAKMYVPTPNTTNHTKDSDSDSSSLDSVDIKKFEKDAKRSKKYKIKK